MGFYKSVNEKLLPLRKYTYTTKVNEKIDVYSFGVVLLELTTGKEPNDGDEHISLAEWAWRHFNEEKSITNALDEEIRDPCYLHEMSLVFRLGIICTCALPSKRPSMTEVLQVLLRCGPQQINRQKKTENMHDVDPLVDTTSSYLLCYKDSHLGSLKYNSNCA
ncbi:hypothetical protein IFM89_029590 [Coptis chinensis]|uniref:Protein kinase domain-containing protein n=1 Tax=Coptis chinensis TaxID=261450 RepID=A0A835IEH4_9MAGN|nr:hypothetical protein IFM89_029590 [Coptis chinensis]